jgi:hypothetical protein
MHGGTAIPASSLVFEDGATLASPGFRKLADLGQGCFGEVTSCMWNGQQVAVKVLKSNSLDQESLGE